MTKKDIEKAMEKAFENAAYYYKRGELKKGKRAEKDARTLKKILKNYE